MDRRYLIEIYSVRFCDSIALRSVASDEPVAGDDDPEWIRDRKSAPVAYVRGARPRMEVVFFLNQSMSSSYWIEGTFVVGAVGPGGGVEEQEVKLSWSSRDEHSSRAGMSKPVVFQLASALPDGIGREVYGLSWYFLDPNDPGRQRFALGDTEHVVCTTWKAPVVRPDQELFPWIYAPIVEWTSTWAAGLDDEKSICDGIMQNLWRAGLQYGLAGWSVRYILLAGGGMCSGWYRLFQAMAASQGVFVHRRYLSLEWREDFLGGQDQVGWCALVVDAGGQNQLMPPRATAWFNDYDGAFPVPVEAPPAVDVTAEMRYQFFAAPGVHADGHAINFLEHAGKLYLYDPSFGTGPIEIDMPLPPDDWSILGGDAIKSFKEGYLDAHVPYLLGSLYVGAELYATDTSSPIVVNGLTVVTANIPSRIEMSGSPPVDGIRLYWGP